MRSIYLRLVLVFVCTGACLLPRAVSASPMDPSAFPAPIRVACVGDSITQGAGADAGKAYPDQLQAILGPKWVVKNYGVGGRTLLKKGDAPWWNEQAFKDAHDLPPDAVVIMLGTNDTKPQNWVHHDEFYGDYKDLVESFKNLPSHPHIYLCLPCPVPDPGNYGITEVNIKTEIPLIQKLATEEGVDLIDIHSALISKPELFPDHVHPNNAGALIMAQTVAQALTGKAN